MTSHSPKKSHKKQKHEEHENHERWLVSYADFITLLFAFFVVMYATSNANVGKQKNFEESIRSNLHLIAVSGGPGSAAKETIDSALAELKIQSGSFPQSGGPREAADYVDRTLDKNMNLDQRKEAIQNVTHDAVGVHVALTASTFFQSGSAKLKSSALTSLDKVAEILKQTNHRIIVQGHTDDTPIMGTEYASNWELAGTRAATVVRYLTKVHKMDPKRFISISYGEQKPIVPNDTVEHKAQNRRIEILIVTDDSKADL